MSCQKTIELPVVKQPRACGALRLTCGDTARGTQLIDLRHSGSMKALFPRPSGDALDVVFLNTAGGVTGGDRFEIDAKVGVNGHLRMTSQAAERAYRAQKDEVGKVAVALDVGAGARLDWLPQETLLYDGSALHRRFEVSLATDATFLAVEPLVIGRTAMGEVVKTATFRDHWRISRSGHLIFADNLDLGGNLENHMAHPAIAGGACAMASVLYAASDAEAFIDKLRPLMTETCGVSLIRDGVLFARFLAPDSFLLRRTLIPVLEILNQSSLPKTWML